MKVLEEFETETGITEDYDPQGDKESGYYSRAFIVEYAEWLEKKLEATLLNNLSIQLPKVKDITDFYCTPGDVESTGYSYISGIHDCYEFMARQQNTLSDVGRIKMDLDRTEMAKELWKMLRKILCDGNLIKHNNDLRKTANFFEDELYALPKSEQEDSKNSDQQNFVVRWNDRPIMTFEEARKKLKNVSAAGHIPPYAESMLKSFYDIIVGRE